MRLFIPIERPRYDAPCYLAALVPFIALAVHQWNFLPRLSDGDYAQYILHAKALAEGRRYTDTGYIFTPFSFLSARPPSPQGSRFS
ncbi:MAG: hypothetical protein U0163_04745 [Gemmatimonadaceae bacterium]